MALKIFISHSVAPNELGIVYAIANEGAKRGASPYIPDRDWNPFESIPDQISMHLKDSDFVLAIATGLGLHLNWLNMEVEQADKQRKPLLIIADNNIKILEHLVHIRIDRMNPSKTISEVSQFLEKYGKDKESKELLTWIGIGGLLFLLVLGGKK
jgi:TIR domain